MHNKVQHMYDNMHNRHIRQNRHDTMHTTHDRHAIHHIWLFVCVCFFCDWFVCVVFVYLHGFFCSYCFDSVCACLFVLFACGFVRFVCHFCLCCSLLCLYLLRFCVAVCFFCKPKIHPSIIVIHPPSSPGIGILCLQHQPYCDNNV